MTSIINLSPEPKKSGGGYPAGGVKGYGIDRDFIARFNESGYRPFMAARQHAPEGWAMPVVAAPPAPVAKRSHKKKHAVPA